MLYPCTHTHTHTYIHTIRTDDYDAKVLGDRLTLHDWQVAMDKINDAISSFFPCGLCFAFNYLCAVCTLGTAHTHTRIVYVGMICVSTLSISLSLSQGCRVCPGIAAASRPSKLSMQNWRNSTTNTRGTGWNSCSADLCPGMMCVYECVCVEFVFCRSMPWYDVCV
jgi:hypothetical protein